MVLIYNFFILLYSLGLRLAALRLIKAEKFLKGRKSWKQNLKNSISGSEKRVWIHVASLGEYEQALPLIEKFHDTYPHWNFVLTFFSPSGFENAKLPDFVKHKFYLPLDTSENAKTFLDLIRPELVVFVKYDIWYHYLHEVKKRNIPSVLISALFREKQLFFKPYGGMMRSALKTFDKIYVQNASSQDLMKHIGISSFISGDTRFDRVKKRIENPHVHEFVKTFSEGKNVLVVGSCWPDDLNVIMPYLNHNFQGRIIFAPHNIGEKDINFLISKIDKSLIRFSKIRSVEDLIDKHVIIIDNIGMLASLYSVGKLAYVGGAFHGSLHNILEPAVFGIPVIFGSKHSKFPEAQMMIDANCGFSISNQNEFSEVMESVSSEDLRREIGQNASKFVTSNLGSTDMILSGIHELIQKTNSGN